MYDVNELEDRMNTKERHEKIYNAAVKAVEREGGVEAIDSLAQNERLITLQNMYLSVVLETSCVKATARRNVAKAMRRARYGVMKQRETDNWGGPRPNQTGRPQLPEEETRPKVSTRLAPGSKELAQAIAEIYGLPGWGHAVEKALVCMVQTEPGLKTRLAEMGIVIEGVNQEQGSI
jgi:hypothetical protein